MQSIVASFTDAWIETAKSNSLIAVRRSHLLQMRGLKHKQVAVLVPTTVVASFTDAWIETSSETRMWCAYAVASFTDAWIETSG